MTCEQGAARPLEATVRSGTIDGTVGDEPLKAVFAREPPDPGAQKPAPPTSIAGDYEFVPRSACLGGKGALEGHGKQVELKAAGGVSGELVYDDGKIAGTATCADGREAEIAGTASNRELVADGRRARRSPPRSSASSATRWPPSSSRSRS